MVRNWVRSVHTVTLVRVGLDVDSLSVEQRIFPVSEGGFPKFVRIDAATAQEPFKRGRSVDGIT